MSAQLAAHKTFRPNISAPVNPLRALKEDLSLLSRCNSTAKPLALLARVGHGYQTKDGVFGVRLNPDQKSLLRQGNPSLAELAATVLKRPTKQFQGASAFFQKKSQNTLGVNAKSQNSESSSDLSSQVKMFNMVKAEIGRLLQTKNESFLSLFELRAMGNNNSNKTGHQSVTLIFNVKDDEVQLNKINFKKETASENLCSKEPTEKICTVLQSQFPGSIAVNGIILSDDCINFAQPEFDQARKSFNTKNLVVPGLMDWTMWAYVLTKDVIMFRDKEKKPKPYQITLIVSAGGIGLTMTSPAFVRKLSLQNFDGISNVDIMNTALLAQQAFALRPDFEAHGNKLFAKWSMRVSKYFQNIDSIYKYNKMYDRRTGHIGFKRNSQTGKLKSFEKYLSFDQRPAIYLHLFSYNNSELSGSANRFAQSSQFGSFESDSEDSDSDEDSDYDRRRSRKRRTRKRRRRSRSRSRSRSPRRRRRRRKSY